MRSLVWPQYEEPKPIDVVAELGTHNGVVNGWYFNTYNGEVKVTFGCSSTTAHNRHSTDRAMSQGPGTMYWTKRDALKVARRKLTEMFAEALAEIDAQIEEA